MAMIIDSTPVRAELVEALPFFFLPLRRKERQSFDKLRTNGFFGHIVP
jgi:hypothetical protein